MIITLHSAIVAAVVLVLVLVLGGRQVAVFLGRLLVFLAVAAGRSGRALDARHEMAEDLLGDEQAALQLGDGLTRGVEEDDVVRTLAVPVDRVREAAAAPRRNLHDLAAQGDDLAGGAVDDRLAPVVRDIGADDEHEFVSAHARRTLLPVGMPR
jgi:hypothetical protein